MNKIESWMHQILQLPQLAVYSPAWIRKIDCRKGEGEREGEREKSKHASEAAEQKDRDCKSERRHCILPFYDY